MKYLDGDNLETTFENIVSELENNYRDYASYFMLGHYYENKNINQAYLCYENAEFYCDQDEDLAIIRQLKKKAEKAPNFKVKKLAVVVVSDNCYQMTKLCIESLQFNNMSSTYELIIVDDASTDETEAWLKTQDDLKLVLNNDHKEISYRYNKGMKAADGENDILLLYSDTVITQNAIFLLRMGLYSDDSIGAVGAVSNDTIDGQLIEAQFDSLEGYLGYAVKNNIPKDNFGEKKIFLDGFSLMLKREAIDAVGLLDNRYSGKMYQFIDYGIRLNLNGWKLISCINCFVARIKNEADSRHEDPYAMQGDDKKVFCQKWNFDAAYFSNARKDIIQLITNDRKDAISVLEVGCGCGATLARIEYLWPHATVKGIELLDNITRIGSNYLDIIQGNIENMDLSYELESFDYIIMGDVLEHLYQPGDTLKRLYPYLKKGGKFLCSIPNIMHESVIASLLHGNFEYQDYGILDRTHIRFFTLSSIKKMFATYELEIENLCGIILLSGEDTPTTVRDFSDINLTVEEQFKVHQYIVGAKK